jgi:hypothetical protein
MASSSWSMPICFNAEISTPWTSPPKLSRTTSCDSSASRTCFESTPGTSGGMSVRHICAGETNLVDGYDERDVCAARVMDGLDRLRLDAIVGRNDEHDDVCYLGAALSKGRKGLPGQWMKLGASEKHKIGGGGGGTWCPGVSRNVICRPLRRVTAMSHGPNVHQVNENRVPEKAPMRWVMPPASDFATDVWRRVSRRVVLPWSTWPITVTMTGRRMISGA